MKNKILVTGDSGFVGQTLTKMLLSSGFQVVGLSRTANTNYPSLSIDLCDLVSSEAIKEKLKAELSGCFAVVHLASRVHVLKETSLDPKSEYFKLNVEATEELARLAASCGVGLFVNLSSIKASGPRSENGNIFRKRNRSRDQAFGFDEFVLTQHWRYRKR